MSLILICYLASKLLRQRHKEFLSKINTNKSHDVDNLPAPILCLCAKELSIPLAYLFNLSLKSVKVPDLWKSANITPVHQSDSKELVKKNRLISLLPITAECLEQIVQTAVYKHISRYLTEWQHGFVKGRSCETQLVLTQRQRAAVLDEGCQIDVTFFDFFRAFESVSRQLLLQKLCSFGISGSLLHRCESY